MTKKTHLFLKNILMKNPPLKILKNVWVNEHSKPAKMWQKISNLATTEKTEIRSRYIVMFDKLYFFYLSCFFPLSSLS